MKICKHEKIQYLEWKMVENNGLIFGSCPSCKSTVSMKPNMILTYKDWNFNYQEAMKLIENLQPNLQILDTLKAEIEAYYKEGVLSEKERDLSLEMLHSNVNAEKQK